MHIVIDALMVLGMLLYLGIAVALAFLLRWCLFGPIVGPGDSNNAIAGILLVVGVAFCLRYSAYHAWMGDQDQITVLCVAGIASIPVAIGAYWAGWERIKRCILRLSN
jgi:hypothetical protein